MHFMGDLSPCASLLNQVICGAVTAQNRNSTLNCKLGLTIHIQTRACQQCQCKCLYYLILNPLQASLSLAAFNLYTVKPFIVKLILFKRLHSFSVNPFIFVTIFGKFPNIFYTRYCIYMSRMESFLAAGHMRTFKWLRLLGLCNDSLIFLVSCVMCDQWAVPL